MTDLEKKMLKALRAAKKALEIAFEYDGDVFGRSHNDATDALVTVRAAIAKAEGRS